MKIENPTCETPDEDLMNEALNHYDEAGSAIHHFRSDIPAAIRFYYKHHRTMKLEKIFFFIMGGIFGVVMMYVVFLLTILISAK